MVSNDCEMSTGGMVFHNMHYSVEIKVSGGGQVTEVTLELHGSKSSGAGLHKSNN